MKKKNKTIEDKLKEASFTNLSEAESARVWSRILAEVESHSILSLWLLKAKSKNMIPLLIGLVIFASAGGTVAAANSAAPGDLLFPVDRAVEEVRIAFAGKGSAELKARLAEERLDEVEKLIERARLSASLSATSTSSGQATTTSKQGGLPRANAESRVAVGVNFAISFLNEVAADVSVSGNAEASAQIRDVVSRLETLTNEADVKAVLKSNNDFKFRLEGTSVGATSTTTSTGQVKINTSGNKTRIEVREDGERIRIEIKDNPSPQTDSDVRIETRIDGSGCVELQTFPTRVICPDEDEDRDKINASGTLNIDLR